MLGYWIFSSTIFEADQRLPDIYLLPEHFQILQNFLGDSQHARIMGNPGAADALVALGHWLYRSQRVVKPTFSASEHPDGPETDRMSSFMRYLLSISLLAVYHPDIEVRNATVALAGHVFHADPVEGDKIQIAEDLFDECDFPHLKAQAVTWIREEFLLAHAGIPAPGAALGVFACPAALEELQHSLFPSIGFLRNQEEHEVASYVERELPFLLQVANFGLFLWSTKKWAHVIPDNMAATVQSRWLEPLRIAVERLAKAGQDLSVQAEVLLDRLRRLAEAEAFGGRGEAEHA